MNRIRAEINISVLFISSCGNNCINCAIKVNLHCIVQVKFRTVQIRTKQTKKIVEMCVLCFIQILVTEFITSQVICVYFYFLPLHH